MIRFVVDGDPVPYLRMTQGEVRMSHTKEHKVPHTRLRKWKNIHRYFNYKRAVQLISMQYRFPRKPEKKLRIEVMMFFRNMRHGDPDNIFKCICDAIFDNDKHVCGCMDYDYDPDNPRVEITVFHPEV